MKCMLINTGRERILICSRNVNQTAFLGECLSAGHPRLKSQILPKCCYFVKSVDKRTEVVDDRKSNMVIICVWDQEFT